MNITATEAKNRFGYFCAQAKSEPVFVEKDGRVDSVIVSVEQFESLRTAADKQTMAQRQRDFNKNYKEWIAVQKQDFDANGLWCDGMRMW